MKRPSGRHPLEIKRPSQILRRSESDRRLHRQRVARRKNRADGPQRRGQNHAAAIAAPQRAGFIDDADRDFPSTAARSRGATKPRSATSLRTTPIPSRKACTAIEWLHQFDPQASQEELRGLLGQMLFSGEDALKPTEAFPEAKRRG